VSPREKNTKAAPTIVCPHCGAVNRGPLSRLEAGQKPNCGKCRQPLFDGHPAELNSAADFDRMISRTEIPVIVDFWAEWCGPCRMIAPALEEIGRELGDKVTIAKLNIDDNPDAPARYGVRGIPTMILFKNGEPAATKVGAAPKTQIQGWLEGAL